MLHQFLNPINSSLSVFEGLSLKRPQLLNSGSLPDALRIIEDGFFTKIHLVKLPHVSLKKLYKPKDCSY